jgi:glycosyltransferase involved in cell wall biosynthesis
MSSGPVPAEQPKIFFVADNLEGGGAERVIADMANYWAKNGWKVTIATLTGTTDQDAYALAPSVRRVLLDMYGPGKTRMGKIYRRVGHVFRLRSELRRYAPDAVISFIHKTNMVTILASFALGLKVIVSERGSPHQKSGNDQVRSEIPLAWYWRALRRLLYRRASLVTALNEDTAEWLEKECRVDIMVIPVALRDMPDLDVEREPIILAVGRLHPVKGFDLLIDAYAKISARFPSWRVIIIGEGPDESTLKSLCSDLGVSDRVEFLGWVRDVETWMARAGLVVLPSRSEAFGNAILESLAMGAPVISSRCSGPLSMIEDGVNGKLVPVDDSVALKNAMEELLANPGIRECLGSEALNIRRRYEQELIMSIWESELQMSHEDLAGA